MNINEIKEYEKNAKKHPERQINLIATSFENFGINQPIVIDKNNVIVAGHGRFLAAKKLGFDEIRIGAPRAAKGERFIPAVMAEELSEVEIKAYRLADNKLNESKWNDELVIEELRGLDSLGFDVRLTGFDVHLIQDAKEDDFDAEAEYQKIKESSVKYGDAYQLGDHRVMCGDSKKEVDFEKLMNGEKARLIFTDPPYNVNYKSPGGLTYSSTKFGGTGGKIFNDDLSDDDCVRFFFDVLKNLYEYSEDDSSIYWWFANKNNHLNREAFKMAGWHMSQIIIWLKNSMVFSRGQDYHRMYEPCMVGWKKGKKHFQNKVLANLKDVFSLDVNDFNDLPDVWYQKRDLTTEYIHPTQKPVRLAERALKRNSEMDDIVVDVFLGSGSTMIACEQLKRIFRGMDLDPKYVEVAIRRWEKFTGNKAIRL